MAIPEFGSVPSSAEFEAVLRFAPILQGLPPERVVRWEGGQTEQVGTIVMPFAVYDRVVDDFVQALYDHGFIQNFDWPGWDEAQGYVERSERLATADLETCIKLLTTHVRKERFCEGHLAEMIISGHLLAVLRRLEELRPPA